MGLVSNLPAAQAASGSFRQLLKLAEVDGLRHAVFGDREVLGRQTFDGLAVLVVDRHDFDHQLRVALELRDAVRRRRAVGGGWRRLLSAGGHQPGKQCGGDPSHL